MLFFVWALIGLFEHHPRLKRVVETGKWTVAPFVEFWTVAGYLHWFLIGVFVLFAILMLAFVFRMTRK